MKMLELRDLHKTFNPGTVNEKVALNGVSLARNRFGGDGNRFSRSSTAKPASATDRSSERIVSKAT